MITSGVASAVSGSVGPAALFRSQPGPSTLLLANSGTASVIYAGPGTAVTSSNGFPVPSGAVSPVVIPVYAGAPGQVWSCVTAGGSASLAWISSSPAGGTGTGTLG